MDPVFEVRSVPDEVAPAPAASSVIGEPTGTGPTTIAPEEVASDPSDCFNLVDTASSRDDLSTLVDLVIVRSPSVLLTHGSTQRAPLGPTFSCDA